MKVQLIGVTYWKCLQKIQHFYRWWTYEKENKPSTSSQIWKMWSPIVWSNLPLRLARKDMSPWHPKSAIRYSLQTLRFKRGPVFRYAQVCPKKRVAENVLCMKVQNWSIPFWCVCVYLLMWNSWFCCRDSFCVPLKHKRLDCRHSQVYLRNVNGQKDSKENTGKKERKNNACSTQKWMLLFLHTFLHGNLPNLNHLIAWKDVKRIFHPGAIWHQGRISQCAQHGVGKPQKLWAESQHQQDR